MMNPFKTKKGLGRGLSSLIGDAESKTIKNKVSISSIIRNKFQPRKNFDKEKMEELTNSIKERGIIQPIIVRRDSNQTNKFEMSQYVENISENLNKEISNDIIFLLATLE